MDEQTDFIQGITKYIQGQLTEAEAMDLWVGLLTYPDWICYLEIELALNQLYRPAPLRTQPQH